jgi:hypothetical protein
MIHAFRLKKTMFDLLEKTHNDVKLQLAEMRKKGAAPNKVTSDKKKTPIETFDAQKEKELLNKYNSCEPGTVEEHFVSIELQDFYYKYRNLDSKYLQKCIDFCNDDITKLQSINIDYINSERASILELARLGTPKEEIEKHLSEVSVFSWTIPAFKRLAIIYEKNKDYDRAIAVCNAAIKYYEAVKNTVSQEDFEERLNRLNSKN